MLSRRGFLGALTALVAVPRSLIGEGLMKLNIVQIYRRVFTRDLSVEDKIDATIDAIAWHVTFSAVMVSIKIIGEVVQVLP